MTPHMDRLTVQARDVARIMRAIGSRKHFAHVKIHREEEPSVELWGTWWDGGSRTEYTAMRPDGATLPLSDYGAKPFVDPGPYVARKTPIPRGCVIVEHGVFCGKPAIPTIHVRQDDWDARMLGCSQVTP